MYLNDYISKVYNTLWKHTSLKATLEHFLVEVSHNTQEILDTLAIFFKIYSNI